MEYPVKKKNKSWKLVSPVKLYKMANPNSSKADEKAPKIKYFKPDSVENSELRFILAKI